MNKKKLMAMNAVVSVSMMVLNVILGMIEVKLLIDVFGPTLNGLLQTGKQVLGYLSLIEAGICAAYMHTLYGAVANKDDNKLSALYGGFKATMRKIVGKMLVAALVISLVYPFFVKDEVEYVYSAMLLFLLSANAILPYALTIVPKYMIVLKEQRFKSELISGLAKAVTYVSEILLLLFTELPLHVLLVACVLISLLSGLVFKVAMKRLYSNQIQKNVYPDFSPNKYSRDVLVHNVSSLVFNSTDNIVISTMGSLSDVTVFSNYNLIVGQVVTLFQSLMDGATATLGIKIARKDKNTYSIYRQLLVGSYCIASVLSVVFFVMINDFITLWVGPDYCVNIINRLLFMLIMFCGIILPVMQNVRSVSGLFKESRNFIVAQALLNLTLTLILVPFIGITGALLGTVIARAFITVPFSYTIVYKKVFSEHKKRLWELPLTGSIVVVCALLFGKVIQSIDFAFIQNDYIIFVTKTVVVVLMSVIVFASYFLGMDKTFRQLCVTTFCYIKGKIRK